MSEERKNIWALIPSRKSDDQLYNRRLMSYFGMAYAAIWFQEILIILIIGIAFNAPVDAAVVAALLGVPTTLAGLGFYKYLQACNMEDHKRTGEPDATISPESTEAVSIPPQERRSDSIANEKEK